MFRGILGHIELPKKLKPETIEIELISDGRTIAVWYATKGQTEVRLRFNIPLEVAKQSRLVVKQRLSKDHPSGTFTSLEDIDLATNVFFLTSKNNKPNKMLR